uniref:Peptidase S1 domain-containing protein n=1 Tax=Panagrolaimus davidi TaxID=227884 RepID=A0A914P6D8_9BILA
MVKDGQRPWSCFLTPPGAGSEAGVRCDIIVVWLVPDCQRVVNGTETPAGLFEFLPALSMIVQGQGIDGIGSDICSSTIISKRHILTAAHCLIISLKSPNAMGPVTNNNQVYRVSGALVDYRPKEQIVKVGTGKEGLEKVQLLLKNYSIQTKFYIHPSYSAHTMISKFHSNSAEPYQHDIAIIEFPEDIDLKIAPVSLASGYVEKHGDTAIAAGYGTHKYTYNSDGTLEAHKPKTLLNATVAVTATLDCIFPIPTLICTGIPDLKADRGDSGGPLMLERNGKFYQIGITSFGENTTSWYERVDLYCNWISNMTKGEAKCQPLPNEPNVEPPVSPPVNPPVPAPVDPNRPIQPEQNNQTATKRPSNVNGTTTLLPGTPQALKTENSSIGFTLNVLLFVFIGIFYFA